MEKVLFKSEQKMNRGQIVEHMQKIVDGIEKGKVNLKSGNDQTNLEIPENAEFEVKVEEEGNEMSLEVELEWKPGNEGEEGLEIG